MAFTADALQEIFVRELQLDENPRSFVVSISGGLDSVCLAWVLKNLQKKFKIRLHLFHMNFNLRAKESKRDEKFVRALAKKWKLPLTVKQSRIQKKTAIQEQARNLRLFGASTVKPGWEWVEAHHLDDQIETFFLKLFRGAGPRGLSGMLSPSLRQGRRVWRPFLGISKGELQTFAQSENLKWIEDSSNQFDLYDRNWLRLKLLPLIHRRFPTAKKSIQRLMKILARETAEKENEIHKLDRKVQANQRPLVWAWDSFDGLPTHRIQDFLISSFRRQMGAELGHEHIVELTRAIQTCKNFSYNAPKNIVVRGSRKSRTVEFNQIRFARSSPQGLKPLAAKSNQSFEGDIFPIDIILI